MRPPVLRRATFSVRQVLFGYPYHRQQRHIVLVRRAYSPIDCSGYPQIRRERHAQHGKIIFASRRRAVEADKRRCDRACRNVGDRAWALEVDVNIVIASRGDLANVTEDEIVGKCRQAEKR